jgi:hypothetical protein
MNKQATAKLTNLQLFPGEIVSEGFGRTKESVVQIGWHRRREFGGQGFYGLVLPSQDLKLANKWTRGTQAT